MAEPKNTEFDAFIEATGKSALAKAVEILLPMLRTRTEDIDEPKLTRLIVVAMAAVRDIILAAARLWSSKYPDSDEYVTISLSEVRVVATACWVCSEGVDLTEIDVAPQCIAASPFISFAQAFALINQTAELEARIAETVGAEMICGAHCAETVLNLIDAGPVE